MYNHIWIVQIAQHNSCVLAHCLAESARRLTILLSYCMLYSFLQPLQQNSVTLSRCCEALIFIINHYDIFSIRKKTGTINFHADCDTLNFLEDVALHHNDELLVISTDLQKATSILTRC